MAAKIMNISLKQHKHKSQALEILDGFPTAFFCRLLSVVSQNLNYLPPTPPDSSEKERIKNVWNNILIAPKKVPQKHNGILKFAQFIYFLQQLACLFCTITFPSLSLWTMPMDHLAWIMSWVPFFRFRFHFFHSDEPTKISQAFWHTNEFLFFFHDGRKKWSYLSLTTYYILFEEILPPLLCLCFSCIVNYQKTSCIDNLYFLFLLFFQFNHFNLLYPTYFFLVFLDQNKFYFSFAVLQRILHFILFFFKNQLKKSKIPFFLSAPYFLLTNKKNIT